MGGVRSSARVGWAAIVGVVIGAACVAGANDPAPAGSAAHVRTAAVVHLTVCRDGAARAVCSAPRLSSR